MQTLPAFFGKEKQEKQKNSKVGLVLRCLYMV
jgi:hypothetical protein